MRLLSTFTLMFTLACAAPCARAVVDDAYSTALEAAVETVKKGFKLRQEYWKGTVTSGFCVVRTSIPGIGPSLPWPCSVKPVFNPCSS